MNGSLGPLTLGCHPLKYKLESRKDKMMESFMADVLKQGYKVFSLGQNMIEPAGT